VRLKFPVARTIEMKLTADGATRALADKILRFRPRGTARPGPVEPRQADRDCAVMPLPDRQVATQPAGPPPWPAVMPGPCDIDSILVAVLRDRVARGEYRVDARTVARKLIAAHGL
jgi:hypothetical protein